MSEMTGNKLSYSISSNIGVQKPKPVLSFSIAGILGEDLDRDKNNDKCTHVKQREREQNKADIVQFPADAEESRTEKNAFIATFPRFEWLDCTRYRPPKVPRSKRKKGTSIRASRQPRVPFTPYQQTTLEKKFQRDHYLTSHAVAELSHILDLPEQRIKIWFQNRRARERREHQTREEKVNT